MRHTKQWMVVVLFIIAGLLLSACSDKGESASTNEAPAYVEMVDGSDFNRVVLTERAAQRMDVQVAAVRDEQVDGAQRLVIPYSSVIYGVNGETWVYVSPKPLTFVRTPITVDYIDGDIAVLLDGPASGTQVAMVGVALLYGIDTGVGK